MNEMAVIDRDYLRHWLDVACFTPDEAEIAFNSG